MLEHSKFLHMIWFIPIIGWQRHIYWTLKTIQEPEVDSGGVDIMSAHRYQVTGMVLRNWGAGTKMVVTLEMLV